MVIYPTGLSHQDVSWRKSDNMNSFISWIGGKKLLRKAILEQFPETGTFDRYIEVFGGAAWLLFSRDSHAKMEVYNDINGELVNLFRVVKYHPDSLQKELDWTLMSREMFFDAIQPARGLTDIQRAARFWIAIKESFVTDCHSFGVHGRDMIKALELLQEASVRLNRVVIEHLDFEHLLKTYDRTMALFYLDPPYYDAEKYYPDRFQPEDHTRLKAALDNIKGRFILSYNDCPEIRTLYEGYSIVEAERLDNLTVKSQSRRYKELIIKNY
jgi:DNA adenine methylase